METTLLSKLLYCAGLFAIIISVVQWFFRFPDISQLAFGLNIALTFIVCAYIHSAFRNVVHDIKELKQAKDKEIKELTESGKVKDEGIEELNKALDKAFAYTRSLEEDLKIKEK